MLSRELLLTSTFSFWARSPWFVKSKCRNVFFMLRRERPLFKWNTPSLTRDRSCGPVRTTSSRPVGQAGGSLSWRLCQTVKQSVSSGPLGQDAPHGCPRGPGPSPGASASESRKCVRAVALSCCYTRSIWSWQLMQMWPSLVLVPEATLLPLKLHSSALR